MVEFLDLYKCETCGTIVQVFHRGDGELVCCGHPMKYLQAHTKEDELEEKHVPVMIDKNKIQVGSMPHPMVPEHHIQFIETISEDKHNLEIKFLNVTDNPEMEICSNANPYRIMEYCNIHGLWKNDNICQN